MQQPAATTRYPWIARVQQSNAWMLAVFFLLCLLVFFNTLSKPFLCDDHMVVHRLVREKDFFINGFFRPLSDITILLCYWIAGLSVPFYNVFNLLVHAGSCLLLFRFCLQAPFFPDAEKKRIAWTASLLFLVYPFHNESVLWMVGRASSLAGFFGFLSLVAVFSRLPSGWKYFLAPLSYFIGLAGYETIFPLPLIVLLFLYAPKKNIRSYLPWVIGYGLAAVLHLLIRYLLSGAIFGSYGERIFTPSSGYVSNAFKVLGRLLLPPSDDSRLLSILFLVLAMLVAGVGFFHWRKRIDRFSTLIRMAAAVVISCVIPIMFGLSTRTSEGDRLLYFTSFFLVLLLAYLVSGINRSAVRWMAAAGLALYFVTFLFIGNTHWIQAGVITNRIVAFIKAERTREASMGIINLPQEYQGALVFRNGLKQALLLEGIDTAGITVIRTLTTDEASEFNNSIIPRRQAGSTFVPPHTTITADAVITVLPVSGDTASFYRKKFSMLYYWNKSSMVPLGD